MPAHLLVLPSASTAAEGLGQEHGGPGIGVHCPALIYTDQETQHSHRAAAHVEKRDGSHLPLAQQETTRLFLPRSRKCVFIFLQTFFTKTIRIVDSSK